MASYHLSVKAISRGQGHSATAAAAYRARSVVYDERTGVTHDYSRMKNRALFTGILTPQDAPAWATDRTQLWNAAEHAETTYNRKKNTARVAQDITLALPHEMTDQQREWLVKDFVREQFTRKGYAVDVAIHEPHEQGDQRNYHAHVLIAERTLSREGFAPTKDRDLKNRTQVAHWREQFANLTNRHLARHGIEARVDHRRLIDQGITDRAPTLHMGKDATAAERKGRRTERGDRAEAITTRNAERQQLRDDLRTIEQEQQRYERPINATQGQIHDARFASDGGTSFAAALAERGLMLAQVTEADLAQVNQQRPADWRPLEAGDYVAVNQRGHVYDLTERNTGLTRADRADWLKELDGTLASVTETQATRAAEREAQRQAWREERTAPTRDDDPHPPPVKEAVQQVGEAAGRATDMAGTLLGGVVQHLAEPLLGALADFFTGGSAPTPTRDAPPPPEPHRERTPPTPALRAPVHQPTPETTAHAPTVQREAQAGNGLAMPRELQEAIRRRAQEIEAARRDREHSRDRER